jgi:hypothetical protein
MKLSLTPALGFAGAFRPRTEASIAARRTRPKGRKGATIQVERSVAADRVQRSTTEAL